VCSSDLALTQILSAIILMILAPTLFEQHGVDLHDPDTSRVYVTRLVKKLLA
jgi:hypothetical protein